MFLCAEYYRFYVINFELIKIFWLWLRPQSHDIHITIVVVSDVYAGCQIRRRAWRISMIIFIRSFIRVSFDRFFQSCFGYPTVFVREPQRSQKMKRSFSGFFPLV